MRRKRHQISDAIQVKLECGPHIEAVGFAYDGEVFYTAIDPKPRNVVPEKLARLRNVSASPEVALVIDEYYEDWTQLSYIRVCGRTKLVPKSAQEERAKAIRLLRATYLQYADFAPIIRITPERLTP